MQYALISMHQCIVTSQLNIILLYLGQLDQESFLLQNCTSFAVLLHALNIPVSLHS